MVNAMARFKVRVGAGSKARASDCGRHGLGLRLGLGFGLGLMLGLGLILGLVLVLGLG